MNAMIRIRRSVIVLFALAFCALLAIAQDKAVLASFKGTVFVTRASGQTQRATGKEKLFPGDEVRTTGNGSAFIMYYTGKEVYLSPNQKHILPKEVQEEGFLSRLGRAFSSLLWRREPPKTVLGATRSLNLQKHIHAITPCYAMQQDSIFRFMWTDTKAKAGSRYLVSILNSEGAVVKSANVTDATEAVLVLSVPRPSKKRQELRWHVRALNTGQTSDEVTFSVLSDGEMRELRDDLGKIADLCRDDSPAYRKPLLEAMLYVDRELFAAAEISLKKVIKEKPDLSIGHELLGDVYTRMGRLELAEAEKKLAEKLSAPQ